MGNVKIYPLRVNNFLQVTFFLKRDKEGLRAVSPTSAAGQECWRLAAVQSVQWETAGMSWWGNVLKQSRWSAQWAAAAAFSAISFIANVQVVHIFMVTFCVQLLHKSLCPQCSPLLQLAPLHWSSLSYSLSCSGSGQFTAHAPQITKNNWNDGNITMHVCSFILSLDTCYVVFNIQSYSIFYIHMNWLFWIWSGPGHKEFFGALENKQYKQNY